MAHPGSSRQGQLLIKMKCLWGSPLSLLHSIRVHPTEPKATSYHRPSFLLRFFPSDMAYTGDPSSMQRLYEAALQPILN